MPKRSRRRSDSRSDSEDTIRKNAKKYRRDRERRDRDRDRDRGGVKGRSRDDKSNRSGSDEGRRKSKKKEKKKAKKNARYEERQQRLKLWKARKGLPVESEDTPTPSPEPDPADSKQEQTKPKAEPKSESKSSDTSDVLAQLAAIKAKLANRKKPKKEGKKEKKQNAASEESLKMEIEDVKVKKEESGVAIEGEERDQIAVKMDEDEKPKLDSQGVKTEPAPESMMKAPAPRKQLRQPRKWVAAVYELIGTEEFDGAPFMGMFEEDKELKGRVYREKDGKLFLYYWRPKRQWIIGDNYSSELGLVFVDTLARTPDQIARPWSFYDGQKGDWVTTEDLLLRRLPKPEEAEAWAASRAPVRVEMKGPPKFEGAPFMGVYEEMIGYNPPVYKHVLGEFYLYYWKLKKQWIVGRDWKTDSGPFMFVESEASSPDKVHTYWNFWDPDINDWNYDEDVWCPKVGTKTVDEDALEEDIDAEAAAAAVTKQALGATEDKAEKDEDKKTKINTENEAGDAQIPTKGAERDEVEEDEKVKVNDGNKADEKTPIVESDDPLEQFMLKLGGAKTEEEREKAAGLVRKRTSKKGQGDRLALEEEAMYDEETLKKKAKEMLTWMEKNKPKLKDLKPVDHSKMDYEPFRKNFYIESPEIAMLTPEEVKEMCKKELDNVRIRGRNCPKPIRKWTHCGLPRKIYRTLERLEYKAPFAIQATAIPAIMSGRDVIGIAKTGSGKTLAFLLPMFRQIMDQRPLEKDEGPIAVILAPTRELAVQIHLEARKFAKPLNVRPVCVYGGASVAEQIAELKRGAEIITATPGRIIDLLCANSGRVTNLTRVTYLVLDEADRMFDLGFEPQIMRVVQNVRPNRQTVMFSATFPRIVEKLAKVCMKQPIEIMIGGRSVATNNVTQFVEVREDDTKFARLLEILGKWYSRGSILVFANKKDEVDFLFQQLIDAGYPCFSVHGDMDQTDRDYAIMDFRKGLRTLMVATSIIARGLDVKDLVLVINYDAPTHYEDYVHRIGRTGRAGKKGTAITFLSKEEEQLALDLVTGLQKAKQVVPKDLQALADEFKAKVSRGEATYYSNKGYDGRGHKFDEEEAQAQANEKRWERIGYGVEEKTDEDYMMEEQKRKEDEQKKAEQALKKAAEEDPIKAQIAAAKLAAMEAKKVIKSKDDDQIASGHALLAAKVKVKQVMSQAKVSAVATTAAARAAAVAQQIKNMMRHKGQAVGVGEDAFFTDEIEINDYPQYARYKMTQKQVVGDIEERYDCTITTKGAFIPAGRKVKDGQRKLWLLIEGKTQIDVLRCKADIRRTLEEAASMRPDSLAKRSGGGKYQVLSITY